MYTTMYDMCDILLQRSSILQNRQFALFIEMLDVLKDKNVIYFRLLSFIALQVYMFTCVEREIREVYVSVNVCL